MRQCLVVCFSIIVVPIGLKFIKLGNSTKQGQLAGCWCMRACVHEIVHAHGQR